MEELSPELQFLPELSDTHFVCGDPQAAPRVGDEFQAEIPPMSLNPTYSNVENRFFSNCSAIPVTWVSAGELKKSVTAKRAQETSADVDMNESLKSIKAKSNRANTENKKKSKKSTCKMRLVPERSTGAWEDAEVGRFLLGLYIFGKNFNQVKKFLETKCTGEILTFYYGKFYKSDKYLRWSESKKRRSRKCVFGKKIFSGWRLQELLTRLIRTNLELEKRLVEVSKSYAERNMSFEDYIDSLKTFVGIDNLVKTMGIGKGKEDLTSLTIEPVKTHQWFTVSSNLPKTKACSSLTSGDIIKYLTGGTRLSKARCNDIFWEAIWPRLLANGWHSEQPQYQSYVCSKDCLVFLVPGIQKFSKRELVKGDHYFDSVTDILAKVVSEPELLEFETGDVGPNVCDAEDDSAHEAQSSQDSPSDRQVRQYLKSPIPKSKPSPRKFTVMDTSESTVFGFRELKCGETECRVPPELTDQKNTGSRMGSNKVTPSNLSADLKKRIHKSKSEKRSSEADKSHMRFTIVDTSSICKNGKPFEVRKLTDLMLGRRQNINTPTREETSIKSLIHEHRQIVAAPAPALKNSCGNRAKHPSSNCTSPQLSSELGSAASFCGIEKNSQDQKTNDGSVDHQLKRKHTEQQFIRRTKPRSANISCSGPSKRRRISACVRTEINRLAENMPTNVEQKKSRVVLRISGPKDMSKMRKPEQQSAEALMDLNLTPDPFDSQIAQALAVNREHRECIDPESPCSTVGRDQPEITESNRNDVTQEMPPTTSRLRQSKRKRPVTTKVLEALESELLLKKSNNQMRKRPNPLSGLSMEKGRRKVQAISDHAKLGKDAEGKKFDAKNSMNLTTEQHLTTEPPRKPSLKVKFSLKQH